MPAPPPPQDEPTIERPDFGVRIPRIDVPERGGYYIDSDFQESEGGVYHLHGHVVVELYNATFKADEAEYDENTNIFKAHGNVSYRNYEHNEVLYCDRAEYNTDTSRGTFYHVRGYTKTKVVARPGVLTTQEPFYFEGAYAEKMEDKYLLHDGIITDCHIPHPWWTLHSNLFDIIPEDRAITHKGIFRVRGVPVFYFPYFYHPLKKEPRKSGFIPPEAGHSTLFGYFVGAGYYWAINRSYDAEYLATDYTSRGVAHHLDLRGKPTQNTDFDIITYGVDDHGVTSNGTTTKAPGVSVTGVLKTQFSDGWIARANVDYLSSYLFRQTFSASFNEAVYSSTNSTAFVTKNFSYYTFNTDVSRIQNFQSVATGDNVIIRKLPEFELTGRDQQIAAGPVPLWVSFDTTFGLYHRVEPTSEPDFYQTNQFTPRADLEPSISSAFHWGGLGITPAFTMHETMYGQSLVAGAVSSSGLNRFAPDFNLDFAFPPIERIFNRKTFLGDKLKHVIEPRLTYRYVTGINDFLNTLRFDQLDLLTDTNELEIGITNRIYAKRGNTVNEVFTWEIYQKRYFNPTFGGALVAGQRNVAISSLDLTGYSFLNGPRNYSPIVSTLRTSPRPGVGIQWQGDYDPLLKRLVDSTFSADIHYKRYFISAGNNLVRPDPAVSPPANQFRAQFGYGDPNRKGWNAALSTIYDYRLGIQEFAIAQVTYNTDCCGFSVEYRRFNFGARDDTTYRFAFSIANIGTFGNLKKQERLF
ncbi:MAG TPA: LPS assembly protein LptD [Bryobacteraceae bacterium]|nr:LPS assembly protein LptD [Bryobacteraceae bacterium]